MMSVSRRQFVQGAGVASLGLLAGCGQLPGQALPPPPRRIGYLGVGTAASSYLEDFRAGLRDLGYVEETNLAVEYRFADGDSSRLPGLASELVDRQAEVLVTHATGVTAARRVTSSIPIVMMVFADPVAIGLIDNLAHPGGNVTGSTFFNVELMAKRLEQLKEVLPSLTEAAVLLNPDYPVNDAILAAIETAATALHLRVQPFAAQAPSEFEDVFAAMAERNLGGLVLHDDPVFVFNADRVAALTTKYRLPAVGYLELARAGGLLAYGVDFRAMYRRAAYFVDRIFKGAKPADLPVERATTFDFVINLKTAQALGLTIPQHVLLQATEIIQ